MRTAFHRNLRIAPLLLLPLAPPPAPAAAPPARVVIRDYAFRPTEITVEPGTTITWRNEDDSPHTVTAGERAFGSGALDTGDSFSLAFDREGDYTYYCLLHPQMTGTVHVVRRQ